MEAMMRLALAQARKALALGEVPVGAVLARGDEVICAGHNRREKDHDPTAHAEIIAIREAARALGASDGRIVWKHIVPNSLASTIVNISLCLGGSIMAISGLSFIGLGVQPPTPEWGSILSTGRTYLRDFWPMITFPGLAIMLTVTAFNLFGDGLRDAMDPKLKN